MASSVSTGCKSGNRGQSPLSSFWPAGRRAPLSSSPQAIRRERLFKYRRGHQLARVQASRLKRASIKRQLRQQSLQAEAARLEENKNCFDNNIKASEGLATGSDGGGKGKETEWAPSLVLGSSLGDDLSAVELAERKVARWDAILEYHETHLPAAVGPVREMRDAAVAERNKLDHDDENNTKAKSALASTAEGAVGSRLTLLRRALKSSQFAPEAANIRAAIQGYTSGSIPYSADFTLIYAGRIVDTCPSYASFCVDRQHRLDRYAAIYGPGWLWYEPPLSGSELGGACEMVKKGFALDNPPSRRGPACGGGYWEITMGFRRRQDWVGRPRGCSERPDGDDGDGYADKRGLDSDSDSGLGSDSASSDPSSSDSALDSDSSDSAFSADPDPDPTAPHLFFSMHLDSGSTRPTLYADDFRALGITPSSYPAQTVAWAQGVWTRTAARLFELDVGLYAGPDLSPVAPNPPDRVWPAEPAALGATMPVIMLDAPLPASQRPPACSRLSGTLPFCAAYLSAVPGTHTLWLGEDRKDVLGAARMPGHMRYSALRPAGHHPDAGPVPPLATGHPSWLARDLGSPERMVFEHNVGRHSLVRDEDLGTGKSVITILPRDDDDDDSPRRSEPEKTWHIEPRKQATQARALNE